jgi:lysophospholipase L1-like esterase
LVSNFPEGTFGGLYPGEYGFYRQNTTLDMKWGPIHYEVKTNEFGFRSHEVQLPKPNDLIRIVTIGDSITDGYFVDNNSTFPYILEEILQDDTGRNIEVLNASIGGGSIDKEYTILHDVVVPLQPDIVILTFVANDISDIWSKDREDLLSFELDTLNLRTQLTEWVFTKTAIGEALMDVAMRAKSTTYELDYETTRNGDKRYDIPGGIDFQENVKIYNQRFHEPHRNILVENFSPEVERKIENYIYVLKEFVELTKDKEIKLLFVYFPPYPQIYDLNTPLQINQRLNRTCDDLSIMFLDLTPPFRKHGQDNVLHLAPIDFHLNPLGNRIIASEIGAFLMDTFLAKMTIE